MKIFIITFELVNPGHNYEKVVQKIKVNSLWARLTSFSYLVVLNATPTQIRDNILSSMQPGDRLFVSACPVPAAWNGLPNDVAKWIQEHQPKNS
jgi:hypothetical protein